MLLVSQAEAGKSPNVGTLSLGCVTSLALLLLAVTTLSLIVSDCGGLESSCRKCLVCSCYFGELWRENLTLRRPAGTETGAVWQWPLPKGDKEKHCQPTANLGEG